jgi:hypothetical protein
MAEVFRRRWVESGMSCVSQALYAPPRPSHGGTISIVTKSERSLFFNRFSSVLC